MVIYGLCAWAKADLSETICRYSACMHYQILISNDYHYERSGLQNSVQNMQLHYCSLDNISVMIALALLTTMQKPYLRISLLTICHFVFHVPCVCEFEISVYFHHGGLE